MTHYLQNYARFNSIAEMDDAVAKHCAFHRNELNKSDQLVLDVIRRYSVKYGAAHLKHATIETVIGKSNATVRRAIRKLEQLCIIQRLHYVRPVMSGLGANIYIILPFDDQGKIVFVPCVTYNLDTIQTYFEVTSNTGNFLIYFQYPLRL